MITSARLLVITLTRVLLAGAFTGDGKSDVFYCGPFRDRCVKDVHVCINQRCEDCDAFTHTCFKENHIPNCTNYCRKILRNSIQKELEKMHIYELEKNQTRINGSCITEEDVGTFSKQNIVMLTIVITAPLVFAITQLINACVIYTFYRQKGRQLLNLFTSSNCFCSEETPKPEFLTLLRNEDEHQTGQKQATGCQERTPTAEVGDEVVIKMHQQQQHPNPTQVPTAQNDVPELVVNGTPEKPLL